MSQLSRAWIFVAHSRDDLEKVRAVRNAIEDAGGEPILFFLKGTTDHDEIEDLIKREIRSRNFFLLCDSLSAKASKWVRSELKYACEVMGKRNREAIDLDADWERQLMGITALMKQATVFLSYSAKDASDVAPIARALADRDFAVWEPGAGIHGGESIAEQVGRAIGDAAKIGYFIHFLSEHSISSPAVVREVEEFTSRRVAGEYVAVSLVPKAQTAGLLPRSTRLMNIIDYSHRDLRRLLDELLPVLGVKDPEQEIPGNA